MAANRNVLVMNEESRKSVLSTIKICRAAKLFKQNFMSKFLSEEFILTMNISYKKSVILFSFKCACQGLIWEERRASERS